jgi:branched-chain amino acid transport system ATP-binding protein
MLRVDGITAGYGELIILRDISVEIKPGSRVALLGANGAGKTTLLKVISGLLTPRQGKVMMDEKDITRWTPHRRAKAGICLLPRARGIFPSLSVEDNIVALSGRTDRKRVIALALEAFPALSSHLKQTAGTLSGGEQQMVALTRAHVTKPKVVLIDEVSMGLAPKIVDGTFEFLRRLADSGVAVVVVEQYIARALEFCDTAFLLSRGSVVYSGHPSGLDGDEVLRHYVGINVAAAADSPVPAGA